MSLLLPLTYIPFFFKIVSLIPGLWRFPIFSRFFRNSSDELPCYVMAPSAGKGKGKKPLASDLPK